MCESDAQDEIQQEQMDAYKQAQDLTKQQYQNQQDIYAPLVKGYQTIFQRGSSQQGFSPEERNDLNARAIEGVATNYASAAKAVGEQEASLGGGDIPLTPGASLASKERLAASSAGELSKEESTIRQGDYEQGYNQWKAAGDNLEGIGAGENPLGYLSASTTSGEAAATTADQIAKASNSWMTAVTGGVGALAGGWASGGFKT